MINNQTLPQIYAKFIVLSLSTLSKYAILSANKENYNAKQDKNEDIEQL